MSTAAVALALLLALYVSRALLRSDRLLTFDAINFALAIEHFNPGLHQPQPPGYPWFVGVLWTIRQVTPTVESAFFWTAILLSWSALLLIWWLGARLFGQVAGIIAALLLVFNPPFWLSSLTNPVRITYAVGCLAVVLAVERMRTSPRPAAWFYAASILLGLAGGFRPTIVLMLSPLLLYAAYIHRIKLWHVAGAAAAGAVPVGIWVAILSSAVGGFDRWVRILAAYSRQEAGGTSALFGAGAGPALYMTLQAASWTALGALSWIWVLPWLRRNRQWISRDTFYLLSVWLLPPLLFYSLVHVGDPDHLLSIIPVTCLVGAAAIAAVLRRTSRGTAATIVTAAVLLNAVLFLKPITKMTKAATYKPVGWLNGHVSSVLDTIDTLPSRSNSVAVFHETTLGWRHVSYYVRDIGVLLLTAGEPALIRNLNVAAVPASGEAAIALTGSTFLFVDAQQQPQIASGVATIDCAGLICTVQPRSDVAVDFRGHRLLLSPASARCPRQ